MVFLKLLFGKKKREKVVVRSQRPTLKGVMTAMLATQAAIFLLLLAGLSLTGTAVAFVASMPLFLLFSPVLVPAGITTTILASGLMAGGSSGVTALTIILWLYKKLTGKEPPKIPGLTPAGGGAAAAPAAGGAAGGEAAKPAKKPAAKPAAKSGK
ncbi:PREDICTED: oleosin-B1-like [Camelina sativa]|uniref:Oleosin-B1-like n=1 Tax=Camelina sativa TaxID=90675 RepID=A0ABM0V8Z4_CAMSA|nr:PREDICTED: oleosin-B1-like [Camelina sativa]